MPMLRADTETRVGVERSGGGGGPEHPVVTTAVVARTQHNMVFRGSAMKNAMIPMYYGLRGCIDTWKEVRVMIW
jgi:hypothetical protein